MHPARTSASHLRQAITILLAFAIATPLVGAAGGTPDEGPSSIWDGPWNPTVSSADVDHFVSLWAPRVMDNAWFNAYVAEKGLPPEIAAEGFHELDMHTKMYLVRALFDHFLTTVPPFAAEFDALPAEDAKARLDEMRTLMTMFIFEKERWQQAIDGLQDMPEREIVDTPVDDTLEKALAPLRTPGAPEPGDATVPAELAPPEVMEVLMDDLFAMSAPTLPPAYDGEATPDVELVIPEPPAGDVIAYTPPEFPQVAPPDLSALLGRVRNAVDASTYAVCVQRGANIGCQPEVPLGTPVPIDTTGDLVPDMTAQLAPGADPAFPAGVTIDIDVNNINPLAAGAPAHVFFVFEVPTAMKRLTVGFDGREAGLSTNNGLRFTLKDLTAALAGNVQARMTLTQSPPVSPMSLTFSVKDLQPTALVVVPGVGTPIEKNALVGAIRFATSSPTLTLDAGLDRLGGATNYAFSVATQNPTRVDAYLQSDETDSGRRNVFEATLDKMPASMSIGFTQAAGGVGATSASYQGSQTIDRFFLRNTLTYNVNVPGTTRVLSADVRGIPTGVSFSMTSPFSIVYASTAPVTSATVRIDEFVSGVLTRGMYGVATGVPTSVSLSGTTSSSSTRVTYTANAVMPSLQAGLIDVPNARTVADVTLTGIPSSVDVQVAGQSFTMNTNAPLGSVYARLSRNNGAVGTAPGDHAFLVKNGAALAVDARLSGIRSVSVDPTNGGTYSLVLSPGGQPFAASALLEGDLSVTADIAALPQSLSLDLRPGSNAFGYSAAAPIPSVRAAMARASTGQAALVELTSLPATLNVAWTLGTAPTVVYDASGSLASAHVFVRQATGQAAFDALVTSLPPYFVATAAADRFSFDARTGASGAPASGTVGAILLRYGSNGLFLTGMPADDHVVLKQTATTTQAELLYTGLKSVGVDVRNDEVHASIKNAAPRRFVVAADTPTALLNGFIDAVPASMTLDYAGSAASYRASSAINRVVMTLDRRDGQFLSLDIQGVPASIDLALNPGGQTIAWSANAPTTRVVVAARLLQAGRNWDAMLDLVTVPAVWDVSLNPSLPRFRGVSGPLGSVFASVTNHGTVTTFGGNFASVVHNSATGNTNAAFRMAGVNLVEVEKTTAGIRGDLRMGGGGAFYVNVDVLTGATKLVGSVSVSPLPTSIQFSQANDVITYNANANFDLSVDIAAGNAGGIASAPTPPSVRGLAVRDGFGCAPSGVLTLCGTAVKARIFLQGFPTAFSADPKNRVVSVTNFRPPADAVICIPFCFVIDRDSLTLDVELDNIVSTSVDVVAVQDGIPSPMTFTFGPITTEEIGGGAKRTNVVYTASGAMGDFFADVVLGDNAGQLVISNIPSSVNIAITMGSSTTTVSSTLSQGISRIFAGAKASVSDASFSGGIELLDVPTTMSLSFGRVTVAPASGESYTVPGMSYTASASTLDINAFVDAALLDGDLTARSRLSVVNLGANTQMTMSGRTLGITSSPATSSLEIHVWGQYRVLKPFSGCWPGCGNSLRVEYSGHAGVVPLTINDLKLKVTNPSNMAVQLGITSAITGSYGTFEFGWSSITAQLDIEARVDAKADFGALGCICVNLVNINIHQLINVNIVFHLATNHQTTNGFLLHVSSPIPCDWFVAYDLHVEIQPHPHFAQTNGFAVSAASSEGGGWLVTPDPFGVIPDLAVWIAAAYTSPLGGGVFASTPCH